MAKRQSLRELQERLAQRLKEAKTEAVVATWLAVEASGQRYLLPLVQSGEIFPWTPVQKVPYTKTWYLGVANLRGGLNGVIDLAGLAATSGEVGALTHQDRLSSESRLISLHPALGVNAVLWIDRLLGLRSPGMFTAEGERPQGSPSFVTRLLIDTQAQAWQEIDLQSLVAEPDFLAIAA